MRTFCRTHFNLREALVLLLGFHGFFSAELWAKTTSQTEIHVTLLGQPCLLQGPFDANTLKNIHSIGPAQVYPSFIYDDSTSSKEQGKKTLGKLQAQTQLPSLLGRYRDRLKSRVESQVLFFEALEDFRKNHSQTVIRNLGMKVLKGNEWTSFDKLLKKMAGYKKGFSENQFRDSVEQLFNFYSEAIEPDPEEDFHKAIKKLNIRYVCTFEDSSTEDD